MSRAALLPLLLALGWAACGPRACERGVEPASTGLVFVRRDEHGSDLYRARLADGAVRPLLETPSRTESWPFWSDAAGRLVFESHPRRRGSRAATLRLFDPATGRVEPLPPADARRQHWPVWAPRDPRLAYVFKDGAGGARGGIGVLDLATSRFERVVVSQGRLRFYRPEFSPDGRRLLAQRSAGAGDSTLWILEPGAEPRRLLESGESFDHKARFTRDGEWVVFTRRARRDGPGRLMRVRADGSGLAPLIPGSRADEHSSRPSPVRDEIAFISRRGDSADAYRMDLNGGPPRRLTRTPTRDEMAPRWSPDGELLLLTTRPVGSRGAELPDTRVVVIDRDGNPLLGLPGTMPDWMPTWD